MRRKWIFLAPLAILAMLVFVVIGGEVVRQLWNWLLPPLFGWRQITFWKALTSMSVNPDAVERTRRNVASAEQKIMLHRLAALQKDEKRDGDLSFGDD